MSTQLTVASDMGMSIQEMMGINTTESTSVSLPRLQQIHSAIMGTMEVAGKKIKTEVIPAGSYKLGVEKDVFIYSENPEVRIFASRQQWSKWDNDKEVMYKTVMTSDLKGDLKDNRGTFNIGRPSGYIEDFKSLPKETQEVIRTVKRTKVVFGTIIMHDAKDADGNSVDGYDKEIPFAIDIKNTDSIRAFDAAMKTLGRKNLLPIQFTFKLGFEEHTLPTGNTYCTMVFSAGDKAEILDTDNDLMRNFVDYIEYVNTLVLNAWADNNKDSGISDEDADLVGQFVNVEKAD